MTIPTITILTVTATSVATATLAVVEGWDVATVTVIGTVICGIITAMSVAIVKILGAVQELKVAAIKAAEDRGKAAEDRGKAVSVAEKSAEHAKENTIKLKEIGDHTNGNLQAMSKRLDDALLRIDEMHKAALAKAAASTPPAPTAEPKNT